MKRKHTARSSMPKQPPSRVQLAKMRFVLENARRNLEIKQQVLQRKLATVEASMAEIERQLAALDQYDGGVPQRVERPQDDDDTQIDTFSLEY